MRPLNFKNSTKIVIQKDTECIICPHMKMTIDISVWRGGTRNRDKGGNGWICSR